MSALSDGLRSTCQMSDLAARFHSAGQRQRKIRLVSWHQTTSFEDATSLPQQCMDGRTVPCLGTVKLETHNRRQTIWTGIDTVLASTSLSEPSCDI